MAKEKPIISLTNKSFSCITYEVSRTRHESGNSRSGSWKEVPCSYFIPQLSSPFSVKKKVEIEKDESPPISMFNESRKVLLNFTIILSCRCANFSYKLAINIRNVQIVFLHTWWKCLRLHLSNLYVHEKISLEKFIKLFESCGYRYLRNRVLQYLQNFSDFCQCWCSN